MPQEESDEICLSEYLMQGIRYKKYIPLMKRQKCGNTFKILLLDYA